MVEEMLAARGLSVTYETIRQWGLKFSRESANRIRQRSPHRGDKVVAAPVSEKLPAG
jgi:putative transposase